MNSTLSFSCPALIISALGSGQGKTTVTAVLGRYFRNQGLKVQVFKIGPDFLDPTIHELATGHPVYQLDLYMGGQEHCKELLCQSAQSSDLILIEGGMGLFDGDPSSADLSLLFDIPVLAVIDASGMAQSFGALALGITQFKPGIHFAGVFANQVAGEGHLSVIKEALPEGIPFYGALGRNSTDILPERHLGVHLAKELGGLDQLLDDLSNRLAEFGPLALPEPVIFSLDRRVSETELKHHELPLTNKIVAVAKDQAFCFIYPMNLDVLEQLGAEIVFFSPLYEDRIPDADILYLPGGYPELYAEQLSANHSMLEAMKAFASDGKTIWAECGGMLYLSEQLLLKDGCRYPMAGLLPGQSEMHPTLQALAYQSVTMEERLKDVSLRGHTFHYSSFETELSGRYMGECPNYKRRSEAFYCHNNIVASYIHSYFASAPELVADLMLNPSLGIH